MRKSLAFYKLNLENCRSFHDFSQEFEISKKLHPGKIVPLNVSKGVAKLRLNNQGIELVSDFLTDPDEYSKHYDEIFLNEDLIVKLGTDILNPKVFPASYVTKKEVVLKISDRHLELKYEDEKIAKKMEELKTLKAKFVAENEAAKKKAEEEAKKAKK